ncbi:MarR family winged helix-turn-helix transcriptional regulator [Acrocarpospora catenulata]|uniref:MarR family winged helix-turn-helix transcriptional regulator n=1 Tax=Acrocarpospora catenulata TaxID=2836182 RepID=UPI001BD9BEFE|nr:MarR family transcriptional regulator [Acrocarpospora catenulata]
MRADTSHNVAAVARFVHLIAASARSLKQNARLRANSGLDVTFTDTHALTLLDVEAPITIGEAAVRLEVDPSRASRQLFHLESLGLIERTADARDGRSSRVATSEAGRRVVASWREVWTNDYLVALADWSTEDIVTLTTYLRRLHHDLTATESGPERAPAGPPAPADEAAVTSRQRALDEFRPVILQFVEWAGAAAHSPTSHRNLLKETKSPVPMRTVDALRVIARHGPLPVSELAERMNMESSRISKHTRDLETHELIERAKDPLDRRSSRLKATRKGVALITRVNEVQQAGIAQAVRTWSREDVQQVMSLLDRYIRILATGHVDAAGWSVPSSSPLAAAALRAASLDEPTKAR